MADSITFNVEGDQAVIRALLATDKETQKLVRERLREFAEPILQESRVRLSRYDTRSAARLGISVRKAGTVSVEQRLRRTTGAHPQFGALQMTEVLVPALEGERHNVEGRIQEAIDDIVNRYF